MADRVLNRDVEEIFRNFVQVAKREGFNVEGWAIEKPATYNGVWRMVDAKDGTYGDTPFPSHLDATNRETYARIQAWIQCLTAIRNNRTNGSN